MMTSQMLFFAVSAALAAPLMSHHNRRQYPRYRLQTPSCTIFLVAHAVARINEERASRKFFQAQAQANRPVVLRSIDF